MQTESLSITPSGGSTSATAATYGYDVDGLLTCASLSTCAAGAANKLTLSYSLTTGALTGTSFGATASTAVSDAYTQNTYGELVSHSAKFGTSTTLYSVTYDGLSTANVTVSGA